MQPNWHAAAAAFLGGFPGDFVAFDTETNGPRPEDPKTLPVQVGFAVYGGGRLSCWGDFLVDWSRGRSPVDRAWFYGSVVEVREKMASLGKPYHVTPEMIERDGVAPEEAMVELRSLLDCGLPLVAHNGYAFDRRLLEACSRRVGVPIAIDVERLVDTGMIEKAFRLGWTPPLPGSCRRADWYQEVSSKIAKGVHWSLDRACEERYGLSKRHGLGTASAHSAGFDSVACATLLGAFGELAAGGSAAA